MSPRLQLLPLAHQTMLHTLHTGSRVGRLGAGGAPEADVRQVAPSDLAACHPEAADLHARAEGYLGSIEGVGDRTGGRRRGGLTLQHHEEEMEHGPAKRTLCVRKGCRQEDATCKDKSNDLAARTIRPRTRWMNPTPSTPRPPPPRPAPNGAPLPWPCSIRRK